jgi:hypothetical protein
MALPNTDIKLSEIYWEAQFGGGSGNPGSPISFKELASASYFDGPNGDNTIAYNAWGQSTLSGANRIYNLSAKTADYLMGDFRDLTYFYDNSTFQVTLQITNNLPLPTTPPDPPDLNDINVTVELYSVALVHQYLVDTGQATSGGGTFGPSAVSQTDDPIIFKGYWQVNIAGANPLFAGCNADLSINGNSKFTGQAIAAGVGGTTFNYNTYSDEDVASFGGFEGLYFDVTVS